MRKQDGIGAARRAEEALVRWREGGARNGEDPEELLRAHPDLEPELRARLEVLSLLRDAAGELAIPEQIGSFRVEAELGVGGMGVVYRAVAGERTAGIDAGDVVALKVVHPHLLRRSGFFRRFVREAELGRQVRHENVVRTWFADADLGDEGAHHFLVMEHVEGRTLRAMLEDLERVPEELCRHVGREVAKGLAAIHAAGIVHRDVKPENVLITRDHVVKLMDLGVARLADEAFRLSRTGGFVGSVLYAAPEQFGGGSGEADGRTDLHALGLLLYELSTGEHPYPGDDYRTAMRNVLETTPRSAGEVNPQISPFFEEVLRTLLEKEPERRFSSAEELVRVLAEGEEGDWWGRRRREIRVETKRPLRRIRIPRETVVHGRETELARLRELYRAVREGEGRVVLVEGEAGIGKTRLVDELVRRLAAEGEDFHFLFGSYPPGGAATASGAWSLAYREHFGAGDLEETLAPYLEESPILVPAFAALLRGEPAPEGAEPLTKDSLQTAFVRVTRSLAREKPTVVMIDDLHFAPEEARALFTALALAVRGHRILLVGTARPDVREDWRATFDRIEQAKRLHLPRLGPKDLGDLFREFFRSDRLAEELGWRIATKSDGNPFFAFEIIRGLIEGQLLRRMPDGTWDTTRVIEEIEIPSTVRDLVHVRVADLTDEERNLLDVASCAGFSFDPLLAADALGLDRLNALQLLGRIEKRHRLVRSAGREFVFDHHQIKEVLYDGLSEPLREAYHARLAEALEVCTGAADVDPKELDGALCVELCDHSLRGVRGEVALRYLNEALRHLLEGHQHGRAIDLLEHVLAMPGLLVGRSRVKALLTLCGEGGPLDQQGRYRRQEEAAREAGRLAEELADAKLEGLSLLALGTVFVHASSFNEAKSAFRRAFAVSRRNGDRQIEMRARCNLVFSWHIQGCSGDAVERQEFAEDAEALVREALSEYRRSGNRRGELRLTSNLGILLTDLGRHVEAREHFERALAMSREIGDRTGEVRIIGNLGRALYKQGRFREAQRLSERYLSLTREIGSRLGEATATNDLGVALERQGLLFDARVHFERALVLFRQIGNKEGEAVSHANLGKVFLQFGKHAEGRVELEASLSICHEIGIYDAKGLVLRELSHLSTEEGDNSAALRAAEEALHLRRATDRRLEIPDSLIQLADLHRRTGDPVAARAALDEALSLYREQERLGDVARALALLACLPGGDADAALAAIAEAGEAGESREIRWLLYQATGEVAHLAAAKRLLDEALAKVPEEYHEGMLANVRVNREIAAAAKDAGL